jgi:hypothetical protein
MGVAGQPWNKDRDKKGKTDGNSVTPPKKQKREPNKALGQRQLTV